MGGNRPARIIFANTVNELMLAVPTPAHSDTLAALTPRKLWLAGEGDCVVTMRPISPRFMAYASRLIGLNPESVLCLSPPCATTTLLADAVTSDGCLDELRGFRDSRSAVSLECYALDRPTWKLAEEIGVLPDGYESRVPASLVEFIYDLNLKSEFRRHARMLGLSIVRGGSCQGLAALASLTEEMLAECGRVIVKLDRSSNGYGHLLLDEGARDTPIRETLEAYCRTYAEQPPWFTVEQFMAFKHVPSVEMLVEDSGVRAYYLCDQRCRNYSFSGMLTPPWDLPPETTSELLRAGQLFGEHLRRAGYRGIFDLDAGVTADGELFFTETNLRRTGGTYLHELVGRLAGERYDADRVWVSDSRRCASSATFDDGLAALATSGLAFSEKTRKGVVLVADTIGMDSKWRYLIVASDGEEADRTEFRLAQVLRFEDAQT